MSNHQWGAEASVFQYPALGSANDDPKVVFQGTLRACFDMAAQLSTDTRAHIEIETDDSVALYNGADVDRIVGTSEFRQQLEQTLQRAAS
jgi:hypothetical protein